MHGMDSKDNVMVKVCTGQNILLGDDISQPCCQCNLTVVETSDMLAGPLSDRKDRNSTLSKELGDLIEASFKDAEGNSKVEGKRFLCQFHAKAPADFGHGGGTFDQAFCTIL